MKDAGKNIVDDGKQYVTEAILKEQLEGQFEKQFGEMKEFVSDSIKESIESFAQILNTSLIGMEARMEIRFSDIESRMATKKDILHLDDKFVPYYKFDELSLRVNKLERNNAQS